MRVFHFCGTQHRCDAATPRRPAPGAGGRTTGAAARRDAAGRRPESRRRPRRWRSAGAAPRSIGPVEHAAAGRRPRPVVRGVRQRQRADEEDRGADRRRARQEVGAAGGAEQAARGAAAERRAHVGALAVLDQHQADHHQRREDLQRQHEIQQACSFFFRLRWIRGKAALRRRRGRWRRNRPPSTTRRRSGRRRCRVARTACAALSGLTLPP